MKYLKTYIDPNAPQYIHSGSKSASISGNGPPRPLPRDEDVEYGAVCDLDLTYWYQRVCVNGNCSGWTYVESTINGITCATTGIPGGGQGSSQPRPSPLTSK